MECVMGSWSYVYTCMSRMYDDYDDYDGDVLLYYRPHK